MKALFMPRLTRCSTALTTRKLTAPLALLLVLGVAGCSTPGPTHAYLASRSDSPILDVRPGTDIVEVPTYLTSINTLYGLAYDPFTDHLFLRVFPGDFIRVIDRPAGKIKRSFYVRGLPAGRGDLTIRSRDRHLFFVHPSLPAVVETTLYGKVIRTFTLEALQSSPAGLAYDQKNNVLFVLQGGDLPHIGTYDLSGRRLSGVALDRDVRLTSLAYDSDAAEFYVPLREENAIGIFTTTGHLLRTLPSPEARTDDFIDVGPRSLIRMF
jgi:hypothetical protein